MKIEILKMVGKPTPGGVKQPFSPLNSLEQWRNYIFRGSTDNKATAGDLDFADEKAEDETTVEEGSGTSSGSQKKARASQTVKPPVKKPYLVKNVPYLDFNFDKGSVDLLITDIPYNVSFLFSFLSLLILYLDL